MMVKHTEKRTFAVTRGKNDDSWDAVGALRCNFSQKLCEGCHIRVMSRSPGLKQLVCFYV
jgi:hypothetical protein